MQRKKIQKNVKRNNLSGIFHSTWYEDFSYSTSTCNYHRYIHIYCPCGLDHHYRKADRPFMCTQIEDELIIFFKEITFFFFFLLKVFRFCVYIYIYMYI